MGYIGRDNSVSTFTKQSITADGGTSFTLNQGVGDSSSILVSIGGIVQQPDVAYTASGTALTFTSAPTNAYPIWVVYLGKELTVSSETGVDEVDTQAGVGNGSATPITLDNSVSSVNDIIVTLNGIAQKPSTDYTVSGTTLTFTTAPSSAMNILVYYLSLSGAANTPANGSVSTASQFVSSGTWPAWNGSNLINAGGDATQADIDGLIASLTTLSFLQNIDQSTALLNMVNGWSDTLTNENSINLFNGTLAVPEFGDSSSSGHTVTAVGNTVVSSENVKIGNSSMYFDGSGDSLTVADSADFDFGTGDVTIEMWVNSSNGGQDRMVSRGSHPTEWFLRSDSTQGEAWKCNIGGTVRNMNTGSNEWADGKWHHVAVCRDGATLRLYVDGVQKDSQACGTGTWNASSGQLVSIGTGANAGSTEYYHGFLDEVRISKTCRYPSGTTFTPSTTAFTSDANTELLVHSNYNNTQTQVAQSTGTIIASIGTGANAAGRLFDGNRAGTNHSGAGTNDYAGKDWGNGVTKTITGFKAWNNENTHGFNVGGSNIEAKLQGSSDGTSWTDLGTTGSVADGAGQPIPFSIGKMSGITTTTAYRYHRVLFNNTTDIRWNEIEFYEGTPTEATFTDSSSNTHTVTAVGHAKHQSVITKFGTDAVYFDGYGAGNGNTYLQVTDHADFDFGTGDFTIESWVYQTETASGGANYHVVWHTSDVDQHGIGLIWHNNGTLQLHFGNGSWNHGNVTGTYNNNQWYHFAEVRSGGTVKFYVDGVEKFSGTRNGTYDGNQSLKFGGWRPVANGAEILGNTFQGYMDEMRISDSARYTSAFTPSSSAFTSDANTLLLIHSEEIAYAAGTGSSQMTYSSNSFTNSHELIDSFPSENISGTNGFTLGDHKKAGQCITLSACSISKIGFWVRRVGNIQGHVTAEIHGVTGTPGSSATSNGIILARSKALESASESTSMHLMLFDFPSSYVHSGGNLWIGINAFDMSGGGSTYLHMMQNTANGDTDGNAAKQASNLAWTGYASNDILYYVYGTENLDLKTKGTDALTTVISPASAPTKGHIEALVDDRIIANGVAVAQGTGTPIGDMVEGGGLSAAFDGDTSQIATAESAALNTPQGKVAWLGKDWGSGVTKTITGFKHYASNNDGTSSNGTNNVNCSVELYGSNTNDTSTATNLGGISGLNFRTNSAIYEKTSGITDTTAYRYHWLKYSTPTNGAMFCSEIIFYETVTTYTTLNTHVIGEMSRDGGTTWSPTTLARSSTGINGATAKILSGDVDFTGDPSGTNVVGRIRTANKHKVIVDGISVNWS